MANYKWSPIEDLPVDWANSSSQELRSLAEIWRSQAHKIKESDSIKEFNEKLKREWAIETGIIENLYSIDRGTTRLLIEQGLNASLIQHGSTDKPPELVISILKDQEEALEGVFDFVAQRRSLSTSYIKELHQALTAHQDTVDAMDSNRRIFKTKLLKGEWKKHPNNPERPDGEMHEYCPPEHVSSEMDNLIKMHHEHSKAGVTPEIEAAWLHHRFAQIHPFQDGNGRVARCLASLIFIRSGWFPLVVDRDRRDEYIKALETADKGDLVPLTNIFVTIQKRAFVKALSISENVLHMREPIRGIIQSAKKRITEKKAQEEHNRQAVFRVSRKLEEITFQKLSDVSREINASLFENSPWKNSVVDKSDQNTEHWFKKQIVDVANELGYFANTRSYKSWVRLKIKEDRQADIVVSFHGLGYEFVGLLAASSFLEFKDKSEEGASISEGIFSVSNEVFQFSHIENEDNIIKRFDEWVGNVIITGLDQWRRHL